MSEASGGASDKLVRVIVVGGTAAAAAHAAGAPPAVQVTTGAAAASGAASDLVSSVWSSLRERWNRNAEAALESGAEEAGMDVDRLLEQLTSTPARQELLASALEGAAHATLEAKIKILGRSLAAGASAAEEAEVDRELLFVRAMAEIEAPHLHLLHQMDHGQEDGVPLFRDQLVALPGVGSAFEPLFGTLQRHGLVHEVSVSELRGVRALMPSEFGRECLERLRQAGGHEDGAEAAPDREREP